MVSLILALYNFKAMKKIMFLAFLILLLPISGSAETNKFSITQVFPEELSPSDVSTVQISLKNIGNRSAYHVVAELLVEELEDKQIPIKVKGNAKKSLGKPETYAVSKGEEITVQYEFWVEKDAEPTVYHIPLRIMWRDDFGGEELEKSEILYFGVRVSEAKRAEVDILNITTFPAKLRPGEEGLIEIELKNIGDATVQSLNVRLLTEYPIIPLSSDLEEYITQMEPSERVTVSFNIAVDGSAEDYTFCNIPLILEYEDKFGSYVKNTTLGVEIKGEPRVLIQEIIVEPSKLTTNTEGLFMITLINVGTESANDVKIKMSGGEDLLTEEYKFIGEITPGDSQTATFGVSVSKDAKIGEHGLTIGISYEDRRGESYSESRIYVLTIFPAEPLISIEYIYAFIVILCLLIIGYVIIAGLKKGKEM